MRDPESDTEKPIITSPAGPDGEAPASVPGARWVPLFRGYSQEEAGKRNLKPSEYQLVKDETDVESPVSSLFRGVDTKHMRQDWEKAHDKKGRPPIGGAQDD